jgi:hypothetical protein
MQLYKRAIRFVKCVILASLEVKGKQVFKLRYM